MKLRRLCKSGGSYDEGDCAAIYLSEDPLTMVGQGRRLDRATADELQDVANDEDAVAIPTETVLRAAGLFLAERGHPSMLAVVQAFLDAEEAR